jgi:hypothetical protein
MGKARKIRDYLKNKASSLDFLSPHLNDLQVKKEEALPNVGVHPSETDGESLTAGGASFNISVQHLVKIFNRNENVILKNFPDRMLSESQMEIKEKVIRADLEKETKKNREKSRLSSFR